MKFGQVYTCENAEKAKKYIGKKGIFSNSLCEISEFPEAQHFGTLADDGGENAYPFVRQDEGLMRKRTPFLYFRPILEAEENRGNLEEFSPKRGNMIFGEIFNYGNAEKAKKFIGKKGIFSDHLLDIIEEPEGRRIGTLVDADGKNVFPFTRQDEDDKRVSFQFFRPILEDDELMTQRQLAEWLAKGHGEYSYETNSLTFNYWQYSKGDEDKPVGNYFLIRRWGDTEWSKPTKAIYEEDCIPNMAINKEDCK